MKDNINPSHYRDHPSGVECIQIAEHFNYNRGNAIKYIWRSGLKNDETEDLKKARWYIDRELERIAPKEIEEWQAVLSRELIVEQHEAGGVTDVEQSTYCNKGFADWVGGSHCNVCLESNRGVSGLHKDCRGNLI